MSSLIIVKKLDIQPPSEDDRRADAQRVKDALGLDSIDIPLTLLKRIPSHRESKLTCIVGRQRKKFKLIDIEADSSYSIALDIGTTNLVAALYDNLSQTVVSEAKLENPQIAFGSDILTRLHHSMSGKDKEVNQCLHDGVHSIIKILCANAGIKEQNIHSLVAAGNTVMSHYFLGLDVSRIPVAPYTPVVRKPGFFNASDLGLNINPEALVYVFPNAGSYVGGDILSGMLASGIYRAEEPSVLIDVGTNAEIVVGNKDWMLVGAGAAGPALEEGIAGIGKRAESGIIYDIEINDDSTDCRTFNNAKAEGICGSGMVSLIHEMYRTGIIGNDGILSIEHKDVQTLNGENVYSLNCSSGSDLVIKQTEINNFLSSKAAMFTLLLVILRSVGLEFRDIDKIFVAGALGNGIDAEKAANIGMLPNWPAEKIIPIGNASLQGALMVLKDSSLLEKEDELTDSITYKHMHDDPEFMKEFRGAIFIPHTNPEMLQV